MKKILFFAALSLSSAFADEGKIVIPKLVCDVYNTEFEKLRVSPHAAILRGKRLSYEAQLPNEKILIHPYRDDDSTEIGVTVLRNDGGITAGNLEKQGKAFYAKFEKNILSDSSPSVTVICMDLGVTSIVLPTFSCEVKDLNLSSATIPLSTYRATVDETGAFGAWAAETRVGGVTYVAMSKSTFVSIDIDHAFGSHSSSGEWQGDRMKKIVSMWGFEGKVEISCLR